jgi:hypothetical protein
MNALLLRSMLVQFGLKVVTVKETPENRALAPELALLNLLRSCVNNGEPCPVCRVETCACCGQLQYAKE